MAVEVHRWQFTVADFARMVQAGILSEDARVELIEGEVRAMSSIGPKHAAVVDRLNAVLSRQVGDAAIVRVQSSIQLNESTQPQPDIAVLRYRDDFYAQALPGPNDVLLVIEVAESSLEYDRDEKIPRYAQSGIPEVWLVDLEAESIGQYIQSDGTAYRQEDRLVRGQSLHSGTVSALTLFVDDIFG